MATADVEYQQLVDDIGRAAPQVYDDLGRVNAHGRLARLRRAIDTYQRTHSGLKAERARFLQRAIRELEKARHDLEGRSYAQTYSPRKVYRGIHRAGRF